MLTRINPHKHQLMKVAFLAALASLFLPAWTYNYNPSPQSQFVNEWGENMDQRFARNYQYPVEEPDDDDDGWADEADWY